MGSHFTLTPGFAAMNALIDSVSSASSVGDDDHPDIRISPESAAAVGLAPVLALALGVVAPGLPHAAIRIAMSDKTASADFFIGFPPPRACAGSVPLLVSRR